MRNFFTQRGFILSDITLIVLSAGTSSRFQSRVKKQWLRIGDEPLWLFVTNSLSKKYNFDKVILTSHKNELKYMQNFSEDITFVAGGSTRQESMKNALKHVNSAYVMVTDVARCCIPSEVIDNITASKSDADCIVPYLPISDTAVLNETTIDRDQVKLIQTPQLSKTEILSKALQSNQTFTDDSSAIKEIGGSIKYITGDVKSKKLTFIDDLNSIDCLKSPSNNFFTGTGFDVHAFEESKQMVLGGINIDVPYGFKAHSDGDVLIHALIDSLLGAIGAGDIGECFPDNDERYKNADSKILLTEVVSFVKSVGYEIVNADITIIAQKPKISPYKESIRTKIAELLGIKKQFVNIKATTTEKLGFIGRGDGVAVQSGTMLKYYNWKV